MAKAKDKDMSGQWKGAVKETRFALFSGHENKLTVAPFGPGVCGLPALRLALRECLAVSERS